MCGSSPETRPFLELVAAPYVFRVTQWTGEGLTVGGAWVNLGFESSCLKEASGGAGHMPCSLEVPTLAPKTQDLGSDFLAPPFTRGPL